MADIYVDTDVSPGGTGTSGDPYASLREAWEAEDANIAAGETWNFFLAGTTEDTAGVTIDGVFALASGVTINFYPWHVDFGASSSKGDGWNATGNGFISTSHYRLVVSGQQVILYVDFGSSGSNANTVNFEGLQFETNYAGSGGSTIGAYNGNTNDALTVKACRIFPNTVGTFPRGVRTDSNAFCSTDIINCLLYYTGTQSVSFFNINKNHSQEFKFINNTCVNTSTGGEDTIDDAGSSNIVRAINNAIFHSVPTTGDIELDIQASTKTVLTNATHVSADRGGGTDITSGDFNSYSTDFRPAASQTNAWGTGGTTNGTNSNVPTTDILGDPRNTSGNTAIGCFAIIAGEGGGGTNTNVSLAAGSYTLTGQTLNADVATSSALAVGSYALTGYALDVSTAINTDAALAAGSYSLTGYDATATTDTAVPLVAGSYALTGLVLGVATAGNTDIGLDVAPYTLTGQTLGINTGVQVSLAAGSYTLTGQTLGVDLATSVQLAAGSYTLSGLALGASLDTLVSLGAGSYTLTGFDAAVNLAGFTSVPLAAGSYALTGYEIVLAAAYGADLAAGSYTLTGYDITASATEIVALGAGSYLLTGLDLATTTFDTAVTLAAGSYTLSGLALGVSLSGLPDMRVETVTEGMPSGTLAASANNGTLTGTLEVD